MALMSDERRKEMEEEMNRFELEISGPGESKSPKPTGTAPSSGAKPLSPPPAPPTVSTLLPEVLKKPAPPPPPPPASPPVVLQPPPAPPLSVLRPQQSSGTPVRFIPHQLQRHPRPQLRPNFGGIRGPPMGSSPFPPHPPPSHFAPPLGHCPPMAGPPMPPCGAMHPGGMMLRMPHEGIGMLPMGLPVPPGFCAPGPMAPPRFDAPPFAVPNVPQISEADAPPSSSATQSVVASAPTIYAAPFMKSQSEVASEAVPSNGQVIVSATAAPPSVQKFDKVSVKVSNEVYTTVGPSVPLPHGPDETVVPRKKEKKKKIVRMAGGQAWEDNSLMDWDNDDFRIFCGDLGNDVTDEVLIRAFSKYPSFVKAKVIRDKRTNKTKGFGFVSFKDPQDFIKAMREMNGRYVGSRPIKLRKSTWKDRNIDLVKKKQREKEKLGLL